MKVLLLTFSLVLFIIPLAGFPQDQEGDLQLPVTDVSELEKQEMEEIPTIDEVEMYEDENQDKKDQEKNDDQGP